MSLGLCVRKDAEGLRKALLRAKARKQRTSYCPVLFQGSALFQESRGTARKQVEVLFSGTDVDGCGPHLLKGVSVCSTSRGVYALAEGFSCKTVRARGTEGTTCSETQKRASASKRGRLRKQWRKGCAERVFASLGLKQNIQNSSSEVSV